MAYNKQFGFIQILVTGYTPLWVDAISAKTGKEVTLYLKNKMSDKFKAWMDGKIENPIPEHVLAKKMPDDGAYQLIKFAGASYLGTRKKAERAMAYQAMETEINKDYNPVRSGKNPGRAVAGDGRKTITSTGNKISRAIGYAIDNSAEHKAKEQAKEASKAKRAAAAFLAKLRKKYFYEREFYPLFSDTDWDRYLLQTYGGAEQPESKTDDEFINKLKEMGLA